MSLGIEYDMVLLPPRHMADAQEQRDFRPCSPRRGRRRRNNCTTAAPHAQLSPPRLTNDANSLVRDLTNVSIMPGTSAATCVAASPTLLASPPMAWGAPALPAPYTIGRVTPALLAPPPTSWEAPASPRQEVSAPSLARGEPSVFNPIPIQPSFNTSAFTSMYANLPFPSGCLHLEEKDGPGPGLDLSGLCDHEAMLQFLFACNELLFDGSDDYSTNEEGYNPSRECFHAEHKEHDEGNQLNMPREDNAPPHTPGNQGSRVCPSPPPPPEVTWPTSSSSTNCMPSSGERTTMATTSSTSSWVKQQVEPLTGEHVPRHATSIVASWKMPRLKALDHSQGQSEHRRSSNLALNHVGAIHH
jgi:hypothetical protein